MKPVAFDGQTHVAGRGQEEYQELPISKNPDGQSSTVSCWELSAEDLEQVKQTGVIWVKTIDATPHVTPILVTATKSDVLPEHKDVPKAANQFLTRLPLSQAEQDDMGEGTKTSRDE